MYDYVGSIEILDKDKKPITNTTIVIAEADVTLTFYLKLVNCTNYVEVYYQTVQKTAIEGSDYLPIKQSVIWHKYDFVENRFIKPISVRIKADNVWEIERKIFYIHFGVHLVWPHQ